MEKPASVFLDTSVLFAAVLLESGGARMILKLGEAGLLRLLVSPQVLREAEGVLQRKAPEAQPFFGILLERAGIQVTQSAGRKEALKLEQTVGHPGDAQIAADALSAKAVYLVTLDKAHLLGNKALQGAVSYLIGSPRDFLSWFRGQLATGA